MVDKMHSKTINFFPKKKPTGFALSVLLTGTYKSIANLGLPVIKSHSFKICPKHLLFIL